MEVNSEKGFAKYSRFDNGKKDNETSLILSTESLNKVEPAKLVLAATENYNYPANGDDVKDFGFDSKMEVEGNQRKLGLKTLLGLSLAFLMVAAGLVAGLFIMDLKIQRLDQQNQNLVLDLKSGEETAHALNETIVKFKNHADKDLITVIQRGDVEAVRLFLEVGANANKKNDGQERPLFYAVRSKQYKIVELLIQNGADVNFRGKYNDTALLEACSRSNLMVVKVSFFFISQNHFCYFDHI